MNEKTRMEIMAANDEFARDGLRVLAIAQRELPAQMEDYTSEVIEKDLTFLGLIAMMDPPRPEVSEGSGRVSHRRNPGRDDHRRLRAHRRKHCPADRNRKKQGCTGHLRFRAGIDVGG